MTRQFLFVIASLLATNLSVSAQDVAMFGNTPSRNMVSDETNVLSEWDVATGENVLWSQPVGSQAYGGPVVANGRVYVGTNNEGRRDPAIEGDKGVVMAFESTSGDFLWQMVHPKLTSGRVNDWPLQGVCSTAFMEGDRIYYISNEAHIVCLDARGFKDGENNGPFMDEEFTDDNAGDIIWSYDMIGELDVFPHNLATGSPLIIGDVLYTVTSNGVDEGHVNIPSPFSPDFIAVDKNTGELLWESNPVGENVLHGAWTNPSYGVINGLAQVIFAGGNGVLEDRQSVGRGFTFHIDVGLDRNRHPEERAGFGPVGERPVGDPGLVHGPFGMIVDDRVQRAVAFGDPRRDRSHNGFA